MLEVPGKRRKARKDIFPQLNRAVDIGLPGEAIKQHRQPQGDGQHRRCKELIGLGTVFPPHAVRHQQQAQPQQQPKQCLGLGHRVRHHHAGRQGQEQQRHRQEFSLPAAYRPAHGVNLRHSQHQHR